MFMILCVIDDASLMPEVLAAWRHAGIRGATILPSQGMHRNLAARLLIPQRYTFDQQAEECVRDHYTLISVVPDEASVQICLREAEKVVGDFTLPNTGIFASWPLGLCKGASDKQRAKE